MKKLSSLMLLAGLLISVSSCSTEAPFKVNAQLTSPYVTNEQTQKDSDTALAKRLNNILDDQIPNSEIKVVVDHYSVLLVGQVASSNDKATAESICKKWPSTAQVLNYLTIVSPPNSPSLNTNSSISSDVKNLVEAKYDLDPNAIQIITVDNVVYIFGTNVGNLSALNDVIKNTYSINKVQKVVNLEQKGDQDYTTE